MKMNWKTFFLTLFIVPSVMVLLMVVGVLLAWLTTAIVTAMGIHEIFVPIVYLAFMSLGIAIWLGLEKRTQ